MNIQELIKVPSPEEIALQRVWILSEYESIGPAVLQQLASRAAENRKKSYSPYSHYQVGAALLSQSGEVYDGANIENVNYSETMHGEETAVSNAIVQGGEVEKNGRQFIRALAVSHSGESAPCGHCRQILIEHSPDDNALVLMVDENGTITGVTSMQILLPYAFTPSHLDIE